VSSEATPDYESLTTPSPIELSRSGLSASAWLISAATIIFIASIIITALDKSSSAWMYLVMGWLFSGFLGFVGYVAVAHTLKLERLKLGAHMFRALNLHAYLALEKNNIEAIQLLSDAESKESGFILRAFRAAGVNVEQGLVLNTIESIRRASTPPYVLIYRDGVLDVPSTFAANVFLRGMSAFMGLFAFIILGLVMVLVTVVISSIVIYLTGRALKGHITRENAVRRVLGLPELEVAKSTPSIVGLVISIVSGGIYLPLYAKKLINSIDAHIENHRTQDNIAL